MNKDKDLFPSGGSFGFEENDREFMARFEHQLNLEKRAYVLKPRPWNWRIVLTAVTTAVMGALIAYFVEPYLTTGYTVVDSWAARPTESLPLTAGVVVLMGCALGVLVFSLWPQVLDTID